MSETDPSENPAPSWANFRSDPTPTSSTQTWKPGDVANQHVLADDGQWLPLAAPSSVGVWEPTAIKPMLIRIGSARLKAAAVIIGVLVLALVLPTEAWDAAPFLAMFGVLYLLPTIVAASAKSHLFGPVVVVNVFLGWTGIGWVVALAMSVVRPRP